MASQEIALLISNAVFIGIVLVYAITIVRASSIYFWNVGDDAIQTRQRTRILRGIVVVCAVALIAAITNIILA